MSVLSDVLVLASLSGWLHVGACVALPLVWGVATEIVFRNLSRRRARTQTPESQHFFIDYHI